MAHVFNQTHYRAPAVWIQSYGGSVSGDSPVIGGEDVNGEPLYIGRAIQADDTIPGKIVPSHGCCYVAYGGDEHSHRQYQVLTNPHGCNLGWVPASDGDVPNGAIQGGQQSDGERLFIGRGHYDGSLVIGKVHPGHRTLYVSFGGKEVPIRDYEVLICRDICH